MILDVLFAMNADHRGIESLQLEPISTGFARATLFLMQDNFAQISKLWSDVMLMHSFEYIPLEKYSSHLQNAITHENWRLIKLMIELELVKSQEDIALAFESVKDWDIFLYLASKFPKMAMKYIYKFSDIKDQSEIMSNYLKLVIWNIYKSLSAMKKYEFGSDPNFMDYLTNLETVDSDWELIAEIGQVNPHFGLDLFIESLDSSFLKPEKLVQRSKYLIKFLSDLWERQKVEKIKGISERIANAMMKASLVGSLEFLQAVTKHDWFSLVKVDLGRISFLDEEHNDFMHNFLNYAKKERTVWILKSMAIAVESNHPILQNYLLEIILKQDLSQEKRLLEKMTKSFAQNKSWDKLLEMVPYARLLAIQAFLKNSFTYKDFQYLHKFITASNTELTAKEQNEFYETLISSQHLSVLNLDWVKKDFTDIQFKKLQAKQNQVISNKCQICMEASIECYFSCKHAIKYKHGACKTCHRKIKYCCPFCRAPLKERKWHFGLFNC